MENQTTIEKTGRARPKRRTSAERIAHVERLREAIKMRKRGAEYQEIADALGWNSRQAAQKAVASVLERALLEDARELKLINLMRLESLVAGVLEKAQKGNLLAVDRLIKITKREGEILGFDQAKANDFPLGFEIVVKNQSDK